MTPSDRVRCFHFSGADALYVDQLGRRVVADAEGSGVLESINAEPRFSIQFDGQKATEFPVEFERYLTVIANGPGNVTSRIVQGLRLPKNASGTRVDLPYHGCGWLLQGPAGCVPRPFFVSLDRGHAPTSATIARGNLESRHLMSFDVGDPASLKACAFRVQNISKVTILSSSFATGETREAKVASHLNRAIWSVNVPPDCIGLIIRKTYDQFHGRQRARVLVNGEMAGWWYEPFQDRVHRWATAEFGFPIETTGQIELAIDPPPSTPLWSFGRVEVFGLAKIDG